MLVNMVMLLTFTTN